MNQPKQFATPVTLARFGCLASSVSSVKIKASGKSQLVKALMKGLKVVETHQGKPKALKPAKKKQYGRT